MEVRDGLVALGHLDHAFRDATVDPRGGDQPLLVEVVLSSEVLESRVDLAEACWIRQVQHHVRHIAVKAIRHHRAPEFELVEGRHETRVLVQHLLAR